MFRTYKNDTDITQSFIDANGDPVTVEIGETVTYLVKREVSHEQGVVSEPPIGMQGITNLYRNPETEKMEIDFIDSPEE